MLCEEYFSTYHTIGNFIVLPNLPNLPGKEGTTLNMWRGCNCHKDLFNDFLELVQCYLQHNELPAIKKIDVFEQLMKSNENFWRQYDYDFAKYCEDFYLTDYAAAGGEYMGGFYERKYNGNQEIEKFIRDFIANAKQVIAHRADIITRNLEALLREYHQRSE